MIVKRLLMGPDKVGGKRIHSEVAHRHQSVNDPYYSIQR